MASLKDIRLRIQSTKNTRQITSAMKLVSAAKLRKAQHNITNMRPYAKSLLRLIADVAETQKVTHKLLEVKHETKSLLVVVIASDRGLCGPFNSSINKFAENFYKTNRQKYEKLDFIFVGRRARDYFSRRNIKPLESILDLARDISYEFSAQIADKCVEHYLSGNYDEVRVIYNEFKSAIAQEVICERLLPVDTKDINSFDQQNMTTAFAKDMIFEPSAEKIIDDLLKKHFSIQMYRCLSESIASEHGARMTAMENATKNAGELIRNLTLTYNKLRQASITTELIEITTGAEALNG